LSYLRHTDWLGSSRLATTWNHGVYSKESYAPFGETYNEQANTSGGPDRSFTGQDQDVVTGSQGTGIYEFMFRKYDPAAGRWLSPDPMGWGSASLENPQSLNRYAYVMNSPLSNVDPNGLDCVYFNEDGTGIESIDHNSDSGECGQNGGDWVNGYTQNNWNVYNANTDTWNISSWDATSIYYSIVGAPSTNPEYGFAPCGGDCTLAYGSISNSWESNQMLAGSMNDFMQWLPSNGVPNSGYNGAQSSLAAPEKWVPNNNYCGRNGAGMPQSNNDWACAMHDYNYFKIGGAGKGYSFFSNPDDSVITTSMLRQADAKLASNVSGTEGYAIQAAVAAGATWTWVRQLF